MNNVDLPNLKEQIPLKNFTTFQIGGPARYFYEAKKTEDVVSAWRWARERKLKVFILGGGSNVLFLDDGFDGLVIKNASGGLKFDDGHVEVDSGYELHSLIMEAGKRGLGGLENLAWIPGTVGGAVYGNVGIRGTREFGDIIESVGFYDGQEDKVKVLSKVQCQFSYRHSVFKNNPSWIILRAVLALSAGADGRMLRAKCDEIRDSRRAKFPQLPSAGCVFENVPMEQAGVDAHLKPLLSLAKGGKLAAGLLIDRAGLKGQKIGGALVSEKHANFIVNTGNATAADVLKLISLIKTRVRDMFGVNLVEEVQIIR